MRDKNDVAIAQKALSLCMQLSGLDKAVGAALLSHFNRQTGQCDPSNERLATLLGVDPRQIRRATSNLCNEQKLFRKRSHGGKSGRASYEPVWSVFREIVTDWDRRMATGSAPANSPATVAESSEEQDKNVRATGQMCPEEQDKNVLQTHIRNPFKEPISPFDPSSSAKHEPKRTSFEDTEDGLLRADASSAAINRKSLSRERSHNAVSRSDAAWSAANYRVDMTVKGLASDLRSAIYELLDDADWQGAVSAEMRRRGAAEEFLILALRQRRYAGAAGRREPVH